MGYSNKSGMRYLGIVLFSCFFLTISSLEMGIEIFKEILNFPLRDNPFFAKVISLGDAFSGDGIEDGESDSSGYICQTLGNLDCEEDHKPQCSGLGVIDCTSDCSGSEDEFKLFMKVMEDPEFSKKYPELAKAKMGNTKEDDRGDMEEEDTTEESKPDPRAKFFSEIKKCTDFSDETLALVSMASGTGGSFGGDTSDPNSLTYVDPDAISDIANVEYDYSDYYDDDEEAEENEDDKDIGKERRNAEKDDEMHQHDEKVQMDKNEDEEDDQNTSRASIEKDKLLEDVKKVEEVTKSELKTRMGEKKIMEKVKNTSNSKKEYYNALNNLDKDNDKDLTEDERISLNMIRSVDEDQEDTNLEEDASNESVKIKSNNITNVETNEEMQQMETKDSVPVEETKDSVPVEEQEEGSGSLERSTQIGLLDEDIETADGNEYEDDDDKLFMDDATTESIIGKIVDIEISNENGGENLNVGIDWEKLNELNENDKINGSTEVEVSFSQPTQKITKDRVKRDVDDIQELFAKSVALLNSGIDNSKRVKRFTKGSGNEALAFKVAKKMRIHLRKKRELETIETPKNMTKPDEMACSVKNMTIVSVL